MKKTINFCQFSLLLAFSFFSKNQIFAQAIPISDARTQLGVTVTVRGIVTNGNEFGKIRYIQDGTAGVGCFPGTGSQAGFDSTVKLGDSIEVTGKLVEYKNLLEISPITAWSIISKNNPQPQPKKLAFSEIGELFEGQLIEVDCAAFAGAGGIFSSQNTYPVTSPAGLSAEVYLSGTSPIISSAIPVGPQKVVGVLTQFGADYQILPRSVVDFAPSACFYITQRPQLIDFSKNSLKINWKTNLPSTSKLLFGTTTALGQEINSTAGISQNHEAELTGLAPGTIFWVKAVASENGENIESERGVFATESNSTGQIKVFFTKNIDVSVGGAQPLLPNGTSPNEAITELFNRLDSATQTIDVAIYNIDQTAFRNRLEAAVARGVRVRYVASEETANSALEPTPNFPVVYGNDISLMHNKFVVVDAEITQKSWVMSGSMNWTQGNIYSDYNNVLWVQDQSLARAYQLEFEEMWGGSGAQPDLAAGLFGPSKKDNTPHQFRIGGRPVECVFSPSDQPTAAIEKVLLSAENDLSFAMFSFTKDELGAAIVNRKNNGVNTRGIIDNPNDSGGEFAILVANGVAVKANNNPGMIHHKYGVVDAFLPASDPTVVTGSHNWSLNGETANDENTLIIHDAKIALMFAMEFEKRYSEITVAVENLTQNDGFDIFPNPVSDIFWVKKQAGFSKNERIDIFNATGNLLETATFLDEKVEISTKNWPAGLYFLKITTDREVKGFSFKKI